MVDKVAWTEFRKIHTGISRELKSSAWNAYKKDDFKEYLSICQEAGFETPLDVGVVETVEDTPVTVEEDTIFLEYAKLGRRLNQFGISMTVDEKRTIEARLAEIARMRSSYEMRRKLVKRAPLPDVEIMLPTSAAEYRMRG